LTRWYWLFAALRGNSLLKPPNLSFLVARIIVG
jgi:hypothetical protein